eukprot:6200674-Pleurochrysis_carterae.AAC.2
MKWPWYTLVYLENTLAVIPSYGPIKTTTCSKLRFGARLIWFSSLAPTDRYGSYPDVVFCNGQKLRAQVELSQR